MMADDANLVFERTAAALAALIEPDFHDMDPESVERAFLKVFPFTGPDPAWIKWLQDRISSLSGAKTSLEQIEPQSFPTLIKSPAAAYFRLKATESEQLVVMGPFNPPVQFFED
ncbi:MAG: hypothetical protein JWM42_1054 [Burkholderia sp.]|jgi:hypothetical protein|nr:hypothetical protein [Burkholderia sp.]